MPAGTCACSRLLQTRYLGTYQVSIEEKVQNEAQAAGSKAPQDYGYNTKPSDYKLMHKTIQSMRHCEAAAEGNEFVAILFEWQARPSCTQEAKLLCKHSQRCCAAFVYLPTKAASCAPESFKSYDCKAIVTI